MNPTPIHFRCPRCAAQIKAPTQLAGLTRHCPGCRQPLLVPRAPEAGRPLLSKAPRWPAPARARVPVPRDAGPVLVPCGAR